MSRLSITVAATTAVAAMLALCTTVIVFPLLAATTGSQCGSHPGATTQGHATPRVSESPQSPVPSLAPSAIADFVLRPAHGDQTAVVATAPSQPRNVDSRSDIDVPQTCPTPCPTATNPGTITAPPILTAAASHPGDGCVATLLRANTWLTAWNGGPVPYLNSSDPATWFHGYRRDCSGYASMALGLPGPGRDSGGLAQHSRPLFKTELRAGDLLINPAPGGAGHVVIFDRWTDPSMTAYLGYEQSGDSGTHHRVIPYPYFHGYQMAPYRLRN